MPYQINDLAAYLKSENITPDRLYAAMQENRAKKEAVKVKQLTARRTIAGAYKAPACC